MHPELVAISNLWQADVAVDRLRAELDQLVAAEKSANEAVASLEATQAKKRAELEELRKQERALSRELDSYTERRNRTRAMLDNGTAPDYAAAERQLNQCNTIIDDLENRGLTLLDGLEGLDAELKALAYDLVRANNKRAEVAAARAARQGPAQAELTEAQAHREHVAAELPNHWRSPYAELRRKRRPALVNMDGETCSVCFTRVPPQRIVEVRMGRAVHVCPGCQGFILP